jgi:CBS domain containing-hemolysin-like protein
MTSMGYFLGVMSLCAVLVLLAYLDRIYRQLGRVTTGTSHDHLEIFEADVEPQLKAARRDATLGFAILSQLALVLVTVETARGVILSPSTTGQALAELLVYLAIEVLLFGQFIPYLLLAKTTGRWMVPLLPVLRAALIMSWPLRALIELGISVTHISDEEAPSGKESQQEGIEALVEAAQEEGYLAQDEAQMIEQVVEFSDKRVLEFMTPRPEIVAVSADATIEQLRQLLVNTRHSRVVVFRGTFDDVVGICHGRDLLQIREGDAQRRKVAEIVRPVLFVPETKLGSELLREMQTRKERMAIAVDEHGLVAGLVTLADVVEEIVGEMGREAGIAGRDIVREADGSVMLRGSVSVDKLQDLFGIEFSHGAEESATTVAGLLNSVAGHVPRAGEQIDCNGVRFEVVEANQRKVLRLRVRRQATAAPVS